MEKLVYIVLINYNSKEHTVECLKSLKEINYENYKVVIVDNNSKDNDFTSIEKQFQGIHVIKNNKNSGFAGANNIGMRYALKNNADYVLLLNNDTTVDKDFLKILVNEAEKDEGIGICTNKILYYYEKNKIWYGGGHISYLKGNSQVEHLNEDDFEESENRFCQFSSGCCMLLRRKAIEEVGLMSEGYFLYYEDVDYSMKFIAKNYKILYCPKSVIYHKESVSTKKLSYNYQYYFARNRLIFIKRNFKLKNKISAYPITILWLIYIILTKGFSFSPCFLGVKDFIKGKYGMLNGRDN